MGNARILEVEDEALVGMYTKLILEEAGHEDTQMLAEGVHAGEKQTLHVSKPSGPCLDRYHPDLALFNLAISTVVSSKINTNRQLISTI